MTDFSFVQSSFLSLSPPPPLPLIFSTIIITVNIMTFGDAQKKEGDSKAQTH